MKPMLALLIAVIFVPQSSMAGDPETLSMHKDRVDSICISSDGNYLASASRSRVVIVDFKTRKEFAAIEARKVDDRNEPFHSVAFSPDSNELAIDHTAYITYQGMKHPCGAIDFYDLKSKKITETITTDILSNPLWALAYSPDGKRTPIKPALRDESLKIHVGVAEGDLFLWKREKLKLGTALALGSITQNAKDHSASWCFGILRAASKSIKYNGNRPRSVR